MARSVAASGRLGGCNSPPAGSLRSANNKWESDVGLIILIILILLLVGAVPHWGYSRGWGYGPSGILGVIVIVIISLRLMGRL